MFKSVPYYFALLFALTFVACGRPIANFSHSKDPVAAKDMSFNNESKKAESYEWDFGDGNQSTESTPSHTYKSSGSYTVTLKAKKGEKVSSKQKVIQIEAPEQCLVELETDYGNMIILLSDATPKHRDNFIKLVEDGFYDDLLFHRVISGFMIQGGDPESRNAKAGKRLGGGGPGYQIPAEFVDSLYHIKGALCAARTNNPEKKSSGSQFYIVQGSKVTDRQLSLTEAQQDFNYSKQQRESYLRDGGTPQLDRNYTVFGQVIQGLEVIDKIAKVSTSKSDRPSKDVKMKMRVIK